MSGINKALADIHEITFALACKYNGNITLDQTRGVLITDDVAAGDKQGVAQAIIELNQAFGNAGNGPETVIKFQQAIKSAYDLIEALESTGSTWKNKLGDDFFKKKLKITETHWTNTKERFEVATGGMPHNNNPSDVVVEVTDDSGTTRYLGVSLKATFGKKDVGMYNGGVLAFVALVSHGNDLADKPDKPSDIKKRFGFNLNPTSMDQAALAVFFQSSKSYVDNMLNEFDTTFAGGEGKSMPGNLADIIREESKKNIIEHFNWDSFEKHPYKLFFDNFYDWLKADLLNPPIDLTFLNQTPPPPFDQLTPDKQLQVLFNCIEVRDKTIKNNYQNYVMEYIGATKVNFKKLIWKFLVPDTKKKFSNDPFNITKIGPRAAPDNSINFPAMKFIIFDLLRNRLFDDFALQLMNNITGTYELSSPKDQIRYINLTGVNNEFLLKVLAGIHQKKHIEAIGDTSSSVPYVKVTSIQNSGGAYGTTFKIPVLNEFLNVSGSTSVRLETSGQCSLILSTNGKKRFIIRVKCESVPPSSIKIDMVPFSVKEETNISGALTGGMANDFNDIDTYINYLISPNDDPIVNEHCREITLDIIYDIQQSLPRYQTRAVTKVYGDIIELNKKLNIRLGEQPVTLESNEIDLINEYFHRIQDEEEDEEEDYIGIRGGGKTRKRRNSVKKRKHKKKKQSSKKKQKGKKPRTRKNN